MNIPLSKYDLDIQDRKNKSFVFDPIRKKWFVATPEEQVRQKLIQYFIHDLNYPKGLIAVEKEITMNSLRKRFDIMLHDMNAQKVILVECKSPTTRIDEQVLRQVLTYNLQLSVPYILVSNGVDHIAAQIKRFSPLQLEWLSSLPMYKTT